MADIKLVITIPEETYKDIQSRDWKNVGKWYSEEWKAIHNGTPLPKGHGRLIDADMLSKGLMERWNTSDKDAERIIREVMADIIVPVVVSTTTIIEADKESEDS